LCCDTAAAARAHTAAEEGLVATYHAEHHRLSHCAPAKRVSASVAPMSTARGIAFKLISAALFAVMSALIRHLGARYPVGQVVFYRSVFALIPVVLVYAWRGELAAVVRTERPLGQAGRGVLSIAGMFFNFGAVARLPLVESNAIAFSSPLFTVALAALILGERVRVYRWSAVVVGFIGVLVVLSPHLSADELTAAIGGGDRPDTRHSCALSAPCP